MVRRVVVPRSGDVDVLDVRSGPPSDLSPGDVRIQVSAAGVNFADLMMRMGLYPEAPSRPFVPGYEVAGTVTEISASVGTTDLPLGARVMALTHFGGYAEEVTTPASKVFPLPEGWSVEEGADFLVAFLTAWTGLVPMARVAKDDRVLIHGIAGGVGLAALQIARAAGAKVAGTCGGPRKTAAARKMGAEHAIDYHREDVNASVRRWAPDGVDVVMEPRGWKALRRGLEVLKPTGRAVSYGVSDMVPGRRRNLIRVLVEGVSLFALHPRKLMDKNLGIFGLNVLKLWDNDDALKVAMARLLEGVGQGQYRPVLDRSFPLTRAGEAHRYLHDRQNIGKVVLTTSLTEA